MLFFPPSSSARGGTSVKHLHSKYSGVTTTYYKYLYFPSVRDKDPLPLLQAHLSIHCGLKDEEVLACRLWQSPAAVLCGFGEANDTLTEGRLQITWLMGYVGVTKGGGEEEGREKSILANLDRRLCVIQTKKKIDMSHTPAQPRAQSCHFSKARPSPRYYTAL